MFLDAESADVPLDILLSPPRLLKDAGLDAPTFLDAFDGLELILLAFDEGDLAGFLPGDPLSELVVLSSEAIVVVPYTVTVSVPTVPVAETDPPQMSSSRTMVSIPALAKTSPGWRP